MTQYADIRNDWKKLLPFVAGILLCAAAVSIILASTLLSKDYVDKTFEEKRVYSGITDSVRDKAKNAYLKTDPPQKVKNDLTTIMAEVITEEPVKKEVRDILDQLYSGKKARVKGKYLQESISSNAKIYNSRKSLGMDASKLDEFIGKSVDAGKETIDVSKYTDKIPVSLSGGTVKAAIFTFLALAALMLNYFMSYDRLAKTGIALIVGGGLLLLVGIVFGGAFKVDEMSFPLEAMKDAAEELKSAVTSRCLIFGLLFSAAGGGSIVYKRMK